MTARFRPAEYGWYRWLEGGGRESPVLVRVEEGDDGRLRLAGLRVDGPVSAELLRAIPVGRIEAAANAQLHTSAPRVPSRRPRARIAPTLRSNAVRGYPDAFYQAVASTYRHLVTTSSRPVAELAAANDVPVTTAQRWVKEARRRQLLSPGQPGKSG